jgi:foldase protein PrsA
MLAAMLCSGLALAQEDTVATVNGEKITRDSFLTVLQARYGPRTLNALIVNRIIAQAAKKARVQVTEEELGRRYLATERGVEMRAPLTGENFEMWLATKSLTREYFRTELYHQMLLEKMVQDQVKVTNDDVSLFYKSNQDRLQEPEMVRAAHICVETEEQAKTLRADILANKISWDDAAKTYSKDPWTKDNGGDLDFMPATDDPFNRAAFALQNNGDISEPVQTALGHHLIKRLAYRAGRTPPFEEVEASIREQMERQQLTRLALTKREEIIKAAKVEQLAQFGDEPAPPAAAPAAPPANP